MRTGMRFSPSLAIFLSPLAADTSFAFLFRSQWFLQLSTAKKKSSAPQRLLAYGILEWDICILIFIYACVYYFPSQWYRLFGSTKRVDLLASLSPTHEPPANLLGILNLDVQIIGPRPHQARVLLEQATRSRDIQTLFKQLVRELTIGDGANRRDQHLIANPLLNRLREGSLVARTALDLLLGMLAPRADVQHIHPVLGQDLRQAHRVGQGPALLGPEALDLLEPVGRRDAQEQRHRLGNGGAHRIHDLERQPRAVLERAAVLVGAMVRHGRQERVQQVAVRVVDLDEVEPGLHRAPRRRGEALTHLIDIRLRHLLGHANILVVRHRAGPLDALRPPAVLDRRPRRKRQERRYRAGLAPGVRQLDAQLLVLRVREVDDALPRRDLRVLPQAGAVRRDAPLG